MKKATSSSAKATVFLILFVCISGILLINACRKIDPQSNESVNLKEELFFSSHKSSEPLVQAINSFMKRRNGKDSFVNTTIERIGYPRWDKAIIIRPDNTSGRGASDSAELTYIPFVRENENFVNAALLVRTLERDTSFRYICDWQYHYAEKGAFEDTTAERIGLTLMTLDKEVFQRTKYIVTDSLLFNSYMPDSIKGMSAHLEFGPEDDARNVNRNQLKGGVVYFYVFVTNYVPFYWQAVTYFNLNNFNFENWNFGNAGGGGSGGGGGSSPPPCPGGISRGAAYDNCTPGWEPMPVDSPEDPCTTAKNSAKRMDSIYTWSKADSVLATIPNLTTETNEKVFPIFRKYVINPHNVHDTTFTNNYSCGSVQTGTDSNFNVTFSVPYLQIHAATLHTHPPKKYAAHSAGDIYELITNSIQDPRFEGSFVHAADSSEYVITITNPSLATAFFATQSQYLTNDKWNVDSDIGKAYANAYDHFIAVHKNDSNQKNLAHEKAMAAVLYKFNSGVILNKKDASGKFKPIVIKPIPDPRKPRKIIYIQDCL